MSKYFILTVVLLFSLTDGFAQDVRFGIKSGVNFSNASQEDLATTSFTSFHLGLVMEARYSDKIALQPEILFSFQGFDFIDEANVDSNSRLTYINVPVMLKYYVIEKLSLDAGPQLGFLNTAKIKRNTSEGSTSENVKGGLRSNDLSLNLGVSLYPFDGFNINARYCHGLTNIVHKSADDNFKNRVLQVSIGYFF